MKRRYYTICGLLLILTVTLGLSGLTENDDPFEKLQSETCLERFDAARMLAEDETIPPTLKIEALIGALRSEIENPTLRAPQIVRGPGDPYTLSEFVRGRYRYHLKNIGEPEILKDFLRRETNDTVRKELIIVLGLLKEKEVLPQLIELLEKDKSDYIRSEAADVLGNLGDKKAIPALKKALNDPLFRTLNDYNRRRFRSDKIYLVRFKAFLSLRRLGVKVRQITPPPGSQSYFEWEYEVIE